MERFMQTTPGITEPRLTKDPLGTEGELTPGPDDINPFRSVEEAEIVEEIEQKERERLYEGDTFRPPEVTVGPKLEPTKGNDPFAFDDISGSGFELPWLD